MKDFTIPPFYIGQEVVANRDTLFFKKGTEFKVINIVKGCCTWLVDVGIQNNGRWAMAGCTLCGNQTELDLNGTIMLHHYVYSPKLPTFEFVSMKELAERQLELTGAN